MEVDAARPPIRPRRATMLSAIFVDRPRLAIVIAIVMVLAGLIAMTRIPDRPVSRYRPAAGQRHGPLPGRERRRRRSDDRAADRSADERRREHALHEVGERQRRQLLAQRLFPVGTNPDINTVNVQNRVSLAEPKIPLDVRKQGLTVRKQSPALLQMIAVYSPDGSRDALFPFQLHDHQHHRLRSRAPAGLVWRCFTASKITACGSGSSPMC